MTKNFLKGIVGALVLVAGYALVNTASACSGGESCYAGEAEACLSPTGCMCDGNLIGENAFCPSAATSAGGSVSGPTALPSVAGVPETCTNAAGCTCMGTISLLQGERCETDGNPTIMTSNGSCQDPDGCSCLGQFKPYGQQCVGFVVPDTTPPTLIAGVVGATNTLNPTFTFTTTEAGSISYIGSCSSTTSNAVTGSNTITFNSRPLINHTIYSDCKIRVTDISTNQSAWLSVPTFTVNVPIGPVGPGTDTTPPTLTAGIVTNTGTATPSFSFTTNEAGTIAYSGACVSISLAAVLGTNTVTFNALATGTYSNCKIQVTDVSHNASAWLSVPTFTLSYTGPTPPVGPVTPGSTSIGGGGGGGSPIDYCPSGDHSPSYYDGKCNGSLTGKNFTGLIQLLDAKDLRGALDLVEISPEYSVLRQYTTSNGLVITLSIPRFQNRAIKSALARITARTIALAKTRLQKLGTATKISQDPKKSEIYNRVGSMISSYNDLSALIFLITDVKRTDLKKDAALYFTDFLKKKAALE